MNTPTTPRADNPFGSRALAERAASANTEAIVQREVAEVQAAMVIAKRFPRDPITAMDRIITSCTRDSLAKESLYQYAKGGTDISAPSIRLAEVLAQNWGNLVCGVVELMRMDDRSECLAYAWDLETNFRDEKRFTVRHWRDTRAGGYAISEEREIYELIANMGARRKRACILTVIPGDVVDAAQEQCEKTLTTKVEINADTIKMVVEQFANFNVTQEMIEKRIQRRLDTITPALWLNLKRIYNSIKDGMSAANDWFDMTAEPVKHDKKKDAPAAGGKLRAAVKDRKKPAEQPAQPGAAEQQSGAQPAPKKGDSGTPELLKKYLSKIADCKDADTLNIVMDETRFLTWDLDATAQITKAYEERRGAIAPE